MTLFAYVATHLANHACGLISLAAAEAARLWFVAFWRSPPFGFLLYAAFIIHISLAFIALYERRTLRMPPLELARIALGFSIPFLLAAHYTGTQLAHVMYGQDDPYIRVAGSYWLRDRSLWPLLLMTAAWMHACFGLHLVLRHLPAYQRRFHWWFASACLLPALGALGYAAMGHEMALRAEDPAWYPAQVAPLDVLNAAQKALLDDLPEAIMAGFALALAGVLLARALRTQSERRTGATIALTYPGLTVRVPSGWSVLEASRAHRIPHLSMCGGRARCSTCRVQVGGDASHCPPPDAIEQRTLVHVGAPAGVRLACQLRPTGDLRVTPLLPVLDTAAGQYRRFGAQLGAERELVILFIDLRRWTGLSEQQLPVDLVYVLEQYFAAVGAAVLEAGGVPNQFIGDSVMAIFGLDVHQAQACRQALAAARNIEMRLGELSARLKNEFGQAVDFGIGIHAGRAAVGAVGYQDTRTLSAVGDAVNTASRLQDLTKTLGVRLVISAPVAEGAGLDISVLTGQDVQIRGRSSLLRVYAIATPRDLPAP